MSANNKLIIATAGSGKTTYIIEKSLSISDANILITTYTQNNAQEIRSKFIQRCGYIPKNITIQTWFSFLIEHGVKPYQSNILEDSINGLILCSTQSGIRDKNNKFIRDYCETKEKRKHYLTNNGDIYSDKLAKFVFLCNERSANAVISRICQIFSHIFIDEVQDLAGYDLEIIKLFLSSKSSILLVGDPRQVTYLTHPPKKHKQYANGAIKQFIVPIWEG